MGVLLMFPVWDFNGDFDGVRFIGVGILLPSAFTFEGDMAESGESMLAKFCSQRCPGSGMLCGRTTVQ